MVVVVWGWLGSGGAWGVGVGWGVGACHKRVVWLEAGRGRLGRQAASCLLQASRSMRWRAAECRLPLSRTQTSEPACLLPASLSCLPSADLTIMEEGTELLRRLRRAWGLELPAAGGAAEHRKAAPHGHEGSHAPGPLPMFTSCCPGWVTTVGAAQLHSCNRRA